MAISKLSIINMGLLQVGAAKLSSLEDDVKAARLATEMYEFCLLEVVDMAVNWKFMTARKKLDRIADPLFGSYDHQYTLPANCRRIIAMCDEDGDDKEYRYRREVYVDDADNQTDVVLTNEDDVYIKFIVLRTDESKYPAWFAKLVADKISMVLAEPMKQRTEIYNKLRFIWDMDFDLAKSGNGAWGDADVGVDGANVDSGNNDVINAPLYGISEDIPEVLA